MPLLLRSIHTSGTSFSSTPTLNIKESPSALLVTKVTLGVMVAVPFSGMVIVPALLLITKLAVLFPLVLGERVTVNSYFLPTPIVVGEAVVVNSSALAPVSSTDVIVTSVPPVLLIVIVLEVVPFTKSPLGAVTSILGTCKDGCCGLSSFFLQETKVANANENSITEKLNLFFIKLNFKLLCAKI